MKKLVLVSILFLAFNAFADDLSDAIYESNKAKVGEILVATKFNRDQINKYLTVAHDVVKLRLESLTAGIKLYCSFRKPTFEYVPNTWPLYIGEIASLIAGGYYLSRSADLESCYNVLGISTASLVTLRLIKNYFECRYLKFKHQEAMKIKEMLHDALIN